MELNGDEAELGGLQEPQQEVQVDPTLGLRFPFPQKCNGQEDQFEDFAYSLRSYLTMSNPLFYDVMKQIEDAHSTAPIVWTNLDRNNQRLSSQLQNALQALCKGPAAKIIRRDPLGLNGFESWRQLWERYRPITRARATNRMSTIIFWKFNQKDFENSFNEWENEINRYDSESDSRFPDEIKIGILIHQTTGHLQHYLQLHTDTSTPYQDLRAIILRYFKTGSVYNQMHQTYNRFGGPSSSSGSQATPMEIDAVWRVLKGKGKGLKGKGKGKGSTQFK